MEKKSTETFKKEVLEKTNEYEVIGEYLGCNMKVEMKHKSCGKNFFVTPNHFLNSNTRCPFCEISKKIERNKKRKLSNQEFLSKLKEKNINYIPLEEYKGSFTKILMKCNKCNTEFSITPNKLFCGRGCPKCANINKVAHRKGKTQKKTTAEIKEKIYNLVGNEYEILEEYKGTDTPILFRHNSDICNNRTFLMSPNMFINSGQRCKICNGTKFTEAYFEKRFNEKFKNEFTYILGFIDRLHLVKVKHKCGYTFETQPQYCLRKDVDTILCPKCHQHSYGNYLIKNFLDKNSIIYDAEVRFEDCKYKSTLRFDFKIFINDAEFILIEFDGPQHKDPNICFGANDVDFKIRQERDEIKNKYCIDNNIKLYRFDNIKTLYNDLKEILVHYKLL